MIFSCIWRHNDIRVVMCRCLVRKGEGVDIGECGLTVNGPIVWQLNHLSEYGGTYHFVAKCLGITRISILMSLLCKALYTNTIVLEVGRQYYSLLGSLTFCFCFCSIFSK